ncbi:MAG: ABC transporter ATP-binding protein [Bacteroidota bacterium]
MVMTTTQHIIQLTNLRCAYGDGPTVLTVPQLPLPAGELIFVVGVSGGGKSTLLETIGLMNRTLKAGEMHFAADGVDLAQLWAPSRVAELDEFRKRHYSFIFQKTNLMPNFTCGENMVLPALFKGVDFKVAKAKVLSYMERLDLEPGIYDKRIVEVSGGQRQRLAFIRAMTADFSILFGDEPTGNLDPNTAREVMQVLKEHLAEFGKTGIVVSHDIELAARFADRIVPITMVATADGHAHGTVDLANILTRNAADLWADAQREYPEPIAHLKQLIA